MTKFVASLLALIVKSVLALLPHRRRTVAQARLCQLLRPVVPVEVNGHTLRLVVPDRHSMYWVTHAPMAEPETNAWISSFGPDDVLFDVGANVGFYSLLAAAHGIQRAYAFEPNPLSFSALVQNVFANNMSAKVVPISLAVAERTELVTFGMSSLEAGTVGNEIGRGAYEMGVPAFSLDDFMRAQGIDRVTHLKIDVDGIEAAILRGCTELLSSPHLKSLLVEINDGNKDQADWMLAHLAAHGWHEVPPPAQGKGFNKFFRRHGAG